MHWIYIYLPATRWIISWVDFVSSSQAWVLVITRNLIRATWWGVQQIRKHIKTATTIHNVIWLNGLQFNIKNIKNVPEFWNTLYKYYIQKLTLHSYSSSLVAITVACSHMCMLVWLTLLEGIWYSSQKINIRWKNRIINIIM